MNAVLLDLMMPKMDGFEMLVRMKESPVLNHIPMLVLTAKKLSKREVDLLRRQAIGLFQKAKIGSDNCWPTFIEPGARAGGNCHSRGRRSL